MSRAKDTNSISGFTLIELLIVIAVIAVLAALAFVALNPLARFQDSRNAQRWADVNAIMKAIELYMVDYEGQIPTIGETGLEYGRNYQVGTGTNCNDTCANPTVALETTCVDYSALLVSGGYLDAMPIDPGDSTASAEETRYYITPHSDNTITVGACSEEQGTASAVPQIYLTR
jgi:prepilin-type N-terminal cleavage/methylation domain-containing protein